MFFENIKIKKQNTTNTMRRNGGFLGYGQNDDDNKKGEGENFERLPNFEAGIYKMISASYFKHKLKFIKVCIFKF